MTPKYIYLWVCGYRGTGSDDQRSTIDWWRYMPWKHGGYITLTSSVAEIEYLLPDEILSPPVTLPSFNFTGPSSSSSTSVINRTPTSNDKGIMMIGLMHLGLSFSYCQYYCNPKVTLHNLLYQRRNSSICGDELLAPPNHRLNLFHRQYFKRKYRITATWGHGGPVKVVDVDNHRIKVFDTQTAMREVCGLDNSSVVTSMTLNAYWSLGIVKALLLLKTPIDIHGIRNDNDICGQITETKNARTGYW
ncbi:hypothetical protein BC941DRAFT_470812 [Chlamydoabsidia padenii]|nr:hypothetical protein BC941DRAFT_470812 [Chlamydoabsidia padenii]